MPADSISPPLLVYSLDQVAGSRLPCTVRWLAEALHPWKELATRTDAAVQLLCHTNRLPTAKARDKYGITSELRKKARLTLFAQEGEDGCLLIGLEKANTTAPVPASKFTIKAVEYYPPTDDDDGMMPLLVYAGESDTTARLHVADAYASDRNTSVTDEAVGWLAVHLADGPQWSKMSTMPPNKRVSARRSSRQQRNGSTSDLAGRARPDRGSCTSQSTRVRLRPEREPTQRARKPREPTTGLLGLLG